MCIHIVLIIAKTDELSGASAQCAFEGFVQKETK